MKMIKIMEAGKFFCLAAVVAIGLVLTTSFSAQSAEFGKGNWIININGAFRASYNKEDCGSTCRDSWHNAGSDAASYDGSNTYLAEDISQVAISGSRRTDSGIKILFMTEWRIDTPEGENGEFLSNFEQYLGLDGPFGLIRAGLIETPYMQTGKMIDPFTSDALSTRFFVDIQSALHHTNGKGRGRATDTIRYDSPISSSGYGFQSFYSIDNSEDDHNAYGAGMTYTSQGMKLFAQYYDNGEPGDDEAYKFGGTMGSERFMIFGQYEFDKGLISLAENLSSLGSEDINTAEGDNTYENNRTTGADVWYMGVAYSPGKMRLIYEYGERKDSSNGKLNKDGHIAWILGVSFSLDKDFYFYAGYLEKEYNDSDRDKDTRFTLGATLTF